MLDLSKIKVKKSKDLRREVPEKILFGIGCHGSKIVPIYASGPCVEQEVYEGLTDDWDYIMPNQPEDDGLWVWEGFVHYAVSSDGECDGAEFDNGKWREPTSDEWYSIMKNRNPWESRIHELYPEEPLGENETWI